MLAQAASGSAAVDMTADDGVRHQLWVIDDDTAIAGVTRTVDALPALYIADGHHRSAAALRVAEKRGGDGPHRYFLSVLFPKAEMTILDYNRVLRNLNGHSAEKLLAELHDAYTIEPSAGAVRPSQAREVGMVLGGRWYRLVLRNAPPSPDPIERLPITLLTRNVIEPIFGITDPRTDKRIDFVGGGRGLGELERRVAAGAAAAAFSLYPTTMADLMAVADAGEIMPPKSTWFEPKLADGMVSHVLD